MSGLSRVSLLASLSLPCGSSDLVSSLTQSSIRIFISTKYAASLPPELHPSLRLYFIGPSLVLPSFYAVFLSVYPRFLMILWDSQAYLCMYIYMATLRFDSHQFEKKVQKHIRGFE